jgi:hypothetical protein
LRRRRTTTLSCKTSAPIWSSWKRRRVLGNIPDMARRLHLKPLARRAEEVGSRSEPGEGPPSWVRTRWPRPAVGSLLALGVVLSSCRGRTPPPVPAIGWAAQTGTNAEKAALLLLDNDGMASIVCLPGDTRRPVPGIALRQILDIAWDRGPVIAGTAATPAHGDERAGDVVVLQVRDATPRKLGKAVRSAHFSPGASALAYEVADGDTGPALPSTHVLELASDKHTELEAFADPLWESDGKHLRGTRLRTDGKGDSSNTVRGSLRARWSRDSGIITIDGRGSAQIPAPAGEAVAWSEDPRTTVAADSCAVLLRPRGGVRHSVVGRFCMGIADDRAVRWSSDGRWLAFPHPGSVTGHSGSGGFFVDVVGIEGGRYPALSALQVRTRPADLAIATAPGSPWFDWSPSGRFLAFSDGASDLRVYDFETGGLALLDKGEMPLWSPRGTYLLVQARGQTARQAIVLTGAAPAAKIDLGPVQDARWLPPQACESLGKDL